MNRLQILLRVFKQYKFLKSMILIFISISFFSCKKLPVNKVQELNSQNNFRYLDARFKLSYKGTSNKFNAKVKIRMRKDSLLWVSITGPVGVEGIRAKVNQDSVFIIDRINKQYVESRLDTLDKILQFKIDYKMLQALLLGETPLEQDENTKISRKGGLLRMKQAKNSIEIESYINPKTSKVEQILLKDLRNKNTLDLIYKDFVNHDGFLFPYKNKVNVAYRDKETMKKAVTEIEIEYLKLKLTNETISFPFNVPDKYRK